MEPDVAVDLFQRAIKNGVKYSIYTGDDDATTQAHFRDKVPYEVEKYSNTVHTKKISCLKALFTEIKSKVSWLLHTLCQSNWVFRKMLRLLHSTEQEQPPVT